MLPELQAGQSRSVYCMRRAPTHELRSRNDRPNVTSRRRNAGDRATPKHTRYTRALCGRA